MLMATFEDALTCSAFQTNTLVQGTILPENLKGGGGALRWLGGLGANTMQ